MKTTMKLFVLAYITVTFGLTSCAKDGDDGAIGPIGEQGISGENGTNGEDGTDGQDGNANVVAYTFDLSAESGSSIPIDLTALTQEAVDNDLIIGYLRNSQSNTYYAIPTSVWPNGTGGFYDIAVDIAIGKYWIHFYQVGTQTFNPISDLELGDLKVVIAESNSSVAGKSTGQSIREELKSNGIEVNDYHAVMDYFGLEY